jgi:hypothetical protein
VIAHGEVAAALQDKEPVARTEVVTTIIIVVLLLQIIYQQAVTQDLMRVLVENHQPNNREDKSRIFSNVLFLFIFLDFLNTLKKENNLLAKFKHQFKGNFLSLLNIKILLKII